MKNIYHDLRYALRVLRKQPAFSLTAVLVLALGIGGSTAIFSALNSLFLKPLVISRPGELIGVYIRDTQRPDSFRGFSYPNYSDLRQQNTEFSGLVAHNLAMVGLTEGDSTHRIFADLVSSNYFSTLGVSLFRGRDFRPVEEKPGNGDPVVILSYSFWQRHGAASNEIGKGVLVNGRVYTVIGIAPRGFTGTTALVSPELYFPLGVYENIINDFEGQARQLGARDNNDLIVFGRLKPGVTAAQADAELALISQRLAVSYPAEDKNQLFFTNPLPRLDVSTNPQSDAEVLLPFAFFMAMAGIVLLIASLNVAGMMLSRSAARRREIGIRIALGARPRNIVQQLFTEALVLSVAGGAGGLLLAYAGPTLFFGSMQRMIPLDLVFSAVPDLRVAAATVGFCILSALIFGLSPARSLSQAAIAVDIKDGVARDAAAGRFSRGNLLVTSQIALTLMLLSAAGLFLRSALAAARLDPGFSVQHQAIVELDPHMVGYDDARGRELYRTVAERLRTVPGVQSASVAATVPFGMMSIGRTIQRADASAAAGRSAGVSCTANIVGGGYFQTFGIPIVRGRGISEADTHSARMAVVLDQAAAKRLWPSGDALGQRVRLAAEDATRPAAEAEVVGIAANIRDNAFGTGDQPHVYLPFGPQYQSDMNIQLRLTSDDAAILQAVRGQIRALDPRLPILNLKTMRSQLDGSMSLWLLRTGAALFVFFSGAALLLATVGLYGLRAYTVARRTREIGIRMALGARPGDARRMVLKEGLTVTAAGLTAGVVLALFAGKAMSSLLYRMAALDPLVLSATVALLFAVSLLACYLPARRASRVDPMVALRHD